MLSFIAIVFDEVVPLWAMATVNSGGLNLPQFQIGILMSVTGACLTFHTFFIYPILAEKVSKVRGFRLGK